ncbi:Hypothetical predicted protein [Lecanosticta acicola]|uniref:DnaJ homologue subfamily C member 28 conserved domain-containing protein n=1 Tax=Lecanosticta acicola TaxID=111012 RepID=A0AAI8YUA9_9PEZI|nr:Hypothetical predicted protein [Lecanosticta acicola]
MLYLSVPVPKYCARCLRACNRPTQRLQSSFRTARHASNRSSQPATGGDGDGEPPEPERDNEQGAMTRRLQEMSEDSLETGGWRTLKAVEEAGFSEELKDKLEKKIADASFKSEHASAFAQANIPASAGRGTRDIAGAQPWTGIESVEDASLRMLNDAHKPLRTPAKVPKPMRGPTKVDTGRPSSKVGAGTRIASAREQSNIYSSTKEQQEGLSDEERAKFRAQMKARYQPGQQMVAATITGLQSLANQRIEDAIGRGQFKNLPDRGKIIERDYNANSPFINTTEYFMNKMIKKQEIVPPWIEKQQEVISTLNIFRRRLRADWKRHVCRSISSRGGSLEAKMKLAEEHAFAERIANPTKKQLEQITALNAEGHLSQISISGELKTPPPDDATIMEEEIKIMEQTFNDDGSLKEPEAQVKIAAQHPPLTQALPPEPPKAPTVPPFRDPQWEETERSYHHLAIRNLNALTRAYNLMAPDLAKKPYYSLERELLTCFADVAPQVASAIRERALAPKIKGVEIVQHKPGGVLEKFSMDKASHVYDERKPQYGFKEFWRDLFAPSKT